MERLRAPGGCPWDREQSFDTIKPYLLEETYEVMDAIDGRDWKGLEEELGDLLLQPVFFAQMAAEAGSFRYRGFAGGDQQQAGAAASACVRRRRRAHGGRCEAALGRDQGRGETSGSEGCWREFRDPRRRWWRRSRSRRGGGRGVRLGEHRAGVRETGRGDRANCRKRSRRSRGGAKTSWAICCS